MCHQTNSVSPHFDTTYIFKNAAESCGTFNTSKLQYHPEIWECNKKSESQQNQMIERTYDEPCVEIIGDNKSVLPRSRSWLCCPGSSDIEPECDTTIVTTPSSVTSMSGGIKGISPHDFGSGKSPSSNIIHHNDVITTPPCILIEHVCTFIIFIDHIVIFVPLNFINNVNSKLKFF